jgi:hypothetical protein
VREQELRVVGKSGNEIIDVVAEPGVTAVHMREVGNTSVSLRRFCQPHRIGIDVAPGAVGLRRPVRGHSAHREHIVLGRASVGGKQPDRQDRIGDDFRRCRVGLTRDIVGVWLVAAALQDRLQIDRHGMLARCDHVLLMHVGRGKAMEQREPGAGAPEKVFTAVRLGASCAR